MKIIFTISLALLGILIFAQQNPFPQQDSLNYKQQNPPDLGINNNFVVMPSNQIHYYMHIKKPDAIYDRVGLSHRFNLEKLKENDNPIPPTK